MKETWQQESDEKISLVTLMQAKRCWRRRWENVAFDGYCDGKVLFVNNIVGPKAEKQRNLLVFSEKTMTRKDKDNKEAFLAN